MFLFKPQLWFRIPTFIYFQIQEITKLDGSAFWHVSPDSRAMAAAESLRNLCEMQKLCAPPPLSDYACVPRWGRLRLHVCSPDTRPNPSFCEPVWGPSRMKPYVGKWYEPLAKLCGISNFGKPEIEIMDMLLGWVSVNEWPLSCVCPCILRCKVIRKQGIDRYRQLWSLRYLTSKSYIVYCFFYFFLIHSGIPFY